MQSGDVIELKNERTGAVFNFVIEIKGISSFCPSRVNLSFAKQRNPYARLTINQAGNVVFAENSKNTLGAIFCLEDVNIRSEKRSTNHDFSHELNQHIVRITCVNLKPKSTGKYFLGVTGSNDLAAIDIQVPDVPVDYDNSINWITENIKNKSSEMTLEPCRDKVLKPWQYIRFLTEGYIQLNQCIPRDTLIKGQRYLTHQLGIPGALVAGGFQTGLGKLSGSMTNAVEVKNLLLQKNSSDSYNYPCKSALDIIEEIFGVPGCCDLSRLNPQIAFRFPEHSVEDTFLDTTDWHTDGDRQGKEHGFSLLVGIFLSDVIEDFCGNLLVWPGSHLYLHRMQVGECGRIDFHRLSNYLRSNTSISEYTDREYKRGEAISINDENIRPSLGRPTQIHARAGDVVILHPDLAHTGGPNTKSSDIRKAVYYRVRVTTNCRCNCPMTTSEDAPSKSKLLFNCCDDCNCSCLNGFRSWEDVVLGHRTNMWYDLKGVEEYRSQLSDILKAI